MVLKYRQAQGAETSNLFLHNKHQGYTLSAFSFLVGKCGKSAGRQQKPSPLTSQTIHTKSNDQQKLMAGTQLQEEVVATVWSTSVGITRTRLKLKAWSGPRVRMWVKILRSRKEYNYLLKDCCWLCSLFSWKLCSLLVPGILIIVLFILSIQL